MHAIQFLEFLVRRLQTFTIRIFDAIIDVSEPLNPFTISENMNFGCDFVNARKVTESDGFRKV